CAARLAVVAAVAEAAAPQQSLEFDEAGLDVVAVDVAEREFANAGRVDQLAAVREVEEPRRGGGVSALAGQLGKLADAGFDARQQAVDQRRLADPGLADEHAGAAIELAAQRGQAIALAGRHLED